MVSAGGQEVAVSVPIALGSGIGDRAHDRFL